MRRIKRIFHVVFTPSINSVKLCDLAILLSERGYKFLSLLVKNRLISKYGIHLGANTKIGKNFSLPHPQGIIIGRNAVVGDNCTIYHNVTLGTKHSVMREKIEYPTIGNNVTIYTGAVLIGGITVGDNTIIGANSLVMTNLDSNSVYVGNPLRKIESNHGGYH
ncbi:serine O-acetyltransferase [Acidaminobacter hydrogenoformans]|uniref:Serine acetyltransferase n=1 Tax=Acidaminobacter hydrogenoformans DSM 2784 TaxID=1120920 RepID=A0A1G5S4S2_9FIRM|nr:DapH/DapD/GlmU-related protein [Acidaminobacter hydrogenoformans]SCZ81402.1 serine O-acetyltransferase [Acidaminobacter hydrogenoformans DSM 2784]